MADIIHIPAGSRFRVDGERYETTEDLDVAGEVLPEPKAQTNPRQALICGDPACQDHQRTLRAKRGRHKGTLMVIYMLPSDIELFGAVQCPQCGQPCRPPQDGEMRKRRSRRQRLAEENSPIGE